MAPTLVLNNFPNVARGLTLAPHLRMPMYELEAADGSHRVCADGIVDMASGLAAIVRVVVLIDKERMNVICDKENAISRKLAFS
jgi:hypothetical protein